MSKTDPIADLLTRIRNANRIGLAQVEIPNSRAKVGVVETLKRSGFVRDFRVIEASVSLPEGQSLAQYFASRKQYVNLRNATWVGPGSGMAGAGGAKGGSGGGGPAQPWQLRQPHG